MIGMFNLLSGASSMTTLWQDLRYAVKTLSLLDRGAPDFASTAVVAAYVPARRAARVDPMTALRNGMRLDHE
jgi:hypothetical protein